MKRSSTSTCTGRGLGSVVRSVKDLEVSMNCFSLFDHGGGARLIVLTISCSVLDVCFTVWRLVLSKVS
jgi:hypothetical protein